VFNVRVATSYIARAFVAALEMTHGRQTDRQTDRVAGWRVDMMTERERDRDTERERESGFLSQANFRGKNCTASSRHAGSAERSAITKIKTFVLVDPNILADGPHIPLHSSPSGR